MSLSINCSELTNTSVIICWVSERIAEEVVITMLAFIPSSVLSTILAHSILLNGIVDTAGCAAVASTICPEAINKFDLHL